MQSQAMDKIVDNVESLQRIANALVRDLGDVHTALLNANPQPSGFDTYEAFKAGLEQVLPMVCGSDDEAERMCATFTNLYRQVNGLITTGDDIRALGNLAGPVGPVGGAEDPGAHAKPDVRSIDPDLRAPADMLEQYRHASPATAFALPTVKAGPTVIESAMAGLAKAVGEIERKNVVSPGERLTQYLSPSVLPAGRGFVKPGVAGLKEYRERLPENASELMTWPDGFYRSFSNSIEQCLFKTPTFLVVIDGIATQTLNCQVYFRSKLGERIVMQEMSIAESTKLSNELELVLSCLK